jgi:hypothetical protein
MDIIQATITDSGFTAGIERSDILPVTQSFNLPDFKKYIFIDTSKTASTALLSFTSMFTTNEQIKVISGIRSELVINIYKCSDAATFETVSRLPNTDGLTKYFPVKFLLPVNNNFYSADVSKDLSVQVPAGKYIIEVQLIESGFLLPQPETRRIKYYSRLQVVSIPQTSEKAYFASVLLQLGALSTNVNKLVTDGIKTNNADIITALGTVKTAVDLVKTAVDAGTVIETANGVKITEVKTAVDAVKVIETANGAKLDTLNAAF